VFWNLDIGILLLGDKSYFFMWGSCSKIFNIRYIRYIINLFQNKILTLASL